MNVPGLSERTLRRDFEKSGVTVNSDIQVCIVYVRTYIRLILFCSHVQLKVLDAAASAHTNCWWWIKADGVDVVAGLGESLRLQWSGYVDLCDGELQTQYQLYRNRLASPCFNFISSVG